MSISQLTAVLVLTVVTLVVVTVDGRPNFIVMQPDDLQFDEVWTPPAHFARRNTFSFDLPNLETLRRNGLQMKRSYTASAMCGTSRYSTITGRYPSRSSLSRQRQTEEEIQQVTIPLTKLIDSRRVEDGNDCTDNNVAALLNKHGYHTGMMGKWHLDNSGRNSVYSYSSIQDSVRDCGFDVAEAVYKDNLNDGWAEDSDFGHNMEYLTEKAIQFINEAMEQQEEFFMYFNPTAPHSSGNVYESLTTLSCLKTPEGVLDDEPVVPGMTAGIGCEAYRQTVVDRGNGDVSNAVLGAIWVDDAVGALVQHLEAIGQLNNTFILFQMDHGQEGKSSLFEPGIRIAQFVHYPDAVPALSVFDGLVSTIDIAPTVLDYAGITSTSEGWYDHDGVSWKDAVAENDPRWNNRCLAAELQTERSITCGCDKMLQLDEANSAGSTTVTTASRNGLVTQSSFLNLCDTDGVYLTSPETSTESVAVIETTDNARLQELLECHVNMTLAANPPVYGLCDSFLLADDQIETAAPVQAQTVTSAPTGSPVASPTQAPLSTVTSVPMKSPAASESNPSDSPVQSSTTTAPSIAPVKDPTQVPQSTASPTLSDDSSIPTSSGSSNVGRICFSSSNKVKVLGKGSVAMDSLQIGDFVLAEHEQYSRVYSFLHKDHAAKATFLSIAASGLEISLEISPDHMLFLSHNQPVRASSVQIGDVLFGGHQVVSIKTVIRQGVYAPVTESGNLVVSGILSSSYVAIFDAPPKLQHWMFHAGHAPIRLLCLLEFEQYCQSETYTAGISDRIFHLVQLVFFVSACGPLFHRGALFLTSPIAGLLYAIEQTLRFPAIVGGVALAIATIYARRESLGYPTKSISFIRR